MDDRTSRSHSENGRMSLDEVYSMLSTICGLVQEIRDRITQASTTGSIQSVLQQTEIEKIRDLVTKGTPEYVLAGLKLCRNWERDWAILKQSQLNRLISEQSTGKITLDGAEARMNKIVRDILEKLTMWEKNHVDVE